MVRTQRLAVAVVCLLLAQASVWAQAFGSISGSIADQRGAAVPKATITLTNTGTNAKRTIEGSDDGTYQANQVPPGTYEVRAEAQGFKTVLLKEVAVQVNTPLTLDITFDVGGIGETVEVVGSEEVINQRDASIGNTFNEKQVRQLPIEGRNVVDLLSLQPGVTKTNVENVDGGYDDQRSGAVNGSRSDQSNVTLDGVDVNDQQEGLAFTSAVPVTLDSVQEFRVTTSNANADQGHSAGAQVALVTKSGTNEFHGSVYEFHRNTKTTANSFFNNLAGIEKPKLIRNVFGFSLGGPFIKNRFFFFVNYEGRRDRSEASDVRLVPTESLRAGIVRYVNTDGRVVSLAPSQIANEIDPLHIGPSLAVLDVFNQYPLPNDNTIGDSLNTSGFRFKAPTRLDNNTYIARADYTINDRNFLFWRGNLADNYHDSLPQFPGQAPRYTYIDNSRGYAVGWTSQLSSNVTNVARYGLTRQGLEFGGYSTGPTTGFRGLNALDPGTYSSSKVIPAHNITDDVSWTHGNHTIDFGANMRFVRFHTTSFDNSYAFSRSNSSWLAGAGRSLQPSDLDPSFTVAYRDAITASLGLLDYVTVTYFYDKNGNALPVGSPAKRDYAADEYEGYVQDTWKVKPNLTVTGGIRYSLYSPPWETNGLQVAPTIPLSQWYQQRVDNAYNGIPANAVENVQFDLAGPANGKKGFYDWDKNNFAPRVAVAYSPGFEHGWIASLTGGPGKTSIRGGFGVFYEHIGAGLANAFDRDGAVGLSTNVENPANSYDPSTSPRFVGQNILPGLPTAPPGGFPTQLSPDSFAITFGLDDSIVTPIDYNIDFSVARELPWGIAVEAAYIGRFARHRLAQSDLANPVNFRDPDSGQDWFTVAGIFADWIQEGRPANTVPNLPYFENLFPGIGVHGLTSTQTAYRVAQRYAPDWTNVLYTLDFYHPSKFGPNTFFDDQYSALAAWRSNENDSYNAAQLLVRKRFGDGLTFDFNYTFAKSIDLTSETERTDDYGSAYGSGFILNAFSPQQNRAVSDYDVTHSINANWLWELPFGHNRAFLSDMPGWADAVLGGWQLSGITRLTSGFPVSPYNGRVWPTNWNLEGPATAVGEVRGETTKNPLPVGPDDPGGPNIFGNPGLAFQSFAHTRAGQSGSRNILRGDGDFTLDFGLAKEFRMPWEGHRLQFRWEVFNATNTARFDPGGISIDITNQLTFGKYTNTLEPPRVMQFGLRYEF